MKLGLELGFLTTGQAPPVALAERVPAVGSPRRRGSGDPPPAPGSTAGLDS